jgi:hypothetical protein
MSDMVTTLQPFFSEPKITEALHAYEKSMCDERTTPWLLSDRIYLYERAEAAFGDKSADPPRHQAFTEMYEVLRKPGKAGWGIFRKAKAYWSVDTTFQALSRLQSQYGRSAVTLLTLPSDPAVFLATSLNAMKGIKMLHSGRTSVVAISKVLHFFNPLLFPIFDEQVMRGEVKGLFQHDWEQYGDLEGVTGDPDLADYLACILVARDLVASDAVTLMRSFKQWAQARWRVEKPRAPMPVDLTTYYSAAFELVAIGAMKLSSDRHSHS